MEVRRFVVKLGAFLARRKLKGYTIPIKMEILRIGNLLILKAEAKRVIGNDGLPKLEKYFSAHVSAGPDKIGPGYQWWYEKYILEEDGSYRKLRSGRYPCSWEK